MFQKHNKSNWTKTLVSELQWKHRKHLVVLIDRWVFVLDGIRKECCIWTLLSHCGQQADRFLSADTDLYKSECFQSNECHPFILLWFLTLSVFGFCINSVFCHWQNIVGTVISLLPKKKSDSSRLDFTMASYIPLSHKFKGSFFSKVKVSVCMNSL